MSGNEVSGRLAGVEAADAAKVGPVEPDCPGGLDPVAEGGEPRTHPALIDAITEPGGAQGNRRLDGSRGRRRPGLAGDDLGLNRPQDPTRPTLPVVADDHGGLWFY